MEPAQADAALRLWRALARRCAGPYGEHAAAPLTLAGWVAWSSGDAAEARVALGMALDLEPHYTFARLLHHSVNEGLDPEQLRSCLRQERRKRVAAATKSRRGPAGPAGRGPGRHSPGGVVFVLVGDPGPQAPMVRAVASEWAVSTYMSSW